MGGRWRTPADAAARLEAAGFDGAHAPQLAAVRGGAALAGLAFAALLAPGLPVRSVVLTALAGSGAGYLAPDVWLRRRAQARERAIARSSRTCSTCCASRPRPACRWAAR